MRLLADLIADNSRGLERIGRASFASGALQSALLDQRPPLGFRRSIVPGRAPLRGRPQFALKPSQGFGRSHRVDQFDRDLIDEIASGTFEGTNVKTGGAGRDARQHRCCLAFRTRWSLNGHDLRLLGKSRRRGDVSHELQDLDDPVLSACGVVDGGNAEISAKGRSLLRGRDVDTCTDLARI